MILKRTISLMPKQKSIDLFPCLNKETANDNPFILHALKNVSFKVENINACARHKHDNYLEIVVVLKNGFYSIVNGIKEKAMVGYTSVLFPDDNHYFIPLNDKKARILNITCYTQTATNIVKALFDKDIVDCKNINFYLNAKQIELVNMYVSAILSANENSVDDIVTSLFSYLFSTYISSYKVIPQEQNYPDWLKDFLYKVKNLDIQDIKISQLYKLSGYSQSRLSIFFRQYVGITLVQYVNNLRLEYACSLLSKTNHKILYISNKVGFYSISRFNKQFKDRYGMTPVEYRKQLPVNNS